ALRKALTHQTTTFAGEIAASVRRRAAVADAAVERPARRAVRRRPRVQVAGFARPGGFVTRGVALTVDAVAVVVLYAAAVTVARLGLGFLPALVDNRRRGLPDFLARTTVVHDLEPAEPEPAALPVTT